MASASQTTLNLVVFLARLIHGFNISVLEMPNRITASEGSNVSIRCQVQVGVQVRRFIVLWLKNDTLIERRFFNLSTFSHTNGLVTATLDLRSVHVNHSGLYNCKAWTDLPVLQEAMMMGTYLHVVIGSGGLVLLADHYGDAVMWSLLSVLSILVLSFCFAFIISRNKEKCRHHQKKRCKKPRVERDSSDPEASLVVYSELNLPKTRTSVKCANENCLLTSTLVTDTQIQDSVTYSVVSCKIQSKNEGLHVSLTS